MSTVITQVELMKYAGMEEVVFSEGTILTPSAKDWAKDHGIRVIIGNDKMSRDQLLETTIRSAVGHVKMNGGVISKEEIAGIVTQCLTKLGCKVD